MSSNAELLRKADLAITNLQTDGGVLAPDEGANFIRKLIKPSVVLREARVVEMNSPQRKINKISFATRILRKAASATALTLNQRSKPTTDQIELSTKEQIAEVRLPYDVLEDNIERATAANNEASNTGPGGLRQTLIELIAQRASTDLEELALLGDITYTSGDADDQAFLSQNDGYLAIASSDGEVVDNGNQVITKTTFKAGQNALPSQYLRDKTAMRHYVSMANELEYRDSLANRGTGLGDAMTTGAAAAMAYGSQVVPVHLLPETDGLFVNPLNLIFGIQRQVSMEFDKDITARVYIIVLTCRVDFKVEEPEAIVRYENIASA